MSFEHDSLVGCFNKLHQHRIFKELHVKFVGNEEKKRIQLLVILFIQKIHFRRREEKKSTYTHHRFHIIVGQSTILSIRELAVIDL